MKNTGGQDKGMDVEAGLDIALRDIVRVPLPDGTHAIGRVIALFESPGKLVRVTVDTPGGDWSGLARDVAVVRMDETNKRWRDGER